LSGGSALKIILKLAPTPRQPGTIVLANNGRIYAMRKLIEEVLYRKPVRKNLTNVTG
jgi:hypothetical protein